MSPSKQVKHRLKPKDKYIGQGGDPGQYYGYKPSWSFSGADRQRWSLFDAELEDLRDMLEKMRVYVVLNSSILNVTYPFII